MLLAYVVASEGMWCCPGLVPENGGVMVQFRHLITMRHYAKSWRYEVISNGGIKAEGLASQRVDILKIPAK